MKIAFSRICVLAAALCITTGHEARAQSAHRPAVLTLPVTGTFQKTAEFTGNISINRFERRGDRIVAVGLLSGVVSQAGRTLGTVVVGELTWPVVIKSGGQLIATIGGSEMATPPRRSLIASPAFRILPVQAAACPVLNIALGPINVDALGAQISLGAVAFDLSGVSGTPLGDLVCAVSELLGNVADLVNVLNSILSLVTGLLGGLTGGLGGV